MEKEKSSDAWTGFTRFILLNERPPEGYTWSGERLTRKQTTSRTDNAWPVMWKHMSDAAKKKATYTNGLSRSQSSIMLDKCEESSLLNLMMKNSDNIIENARRMLEVPMPVVVLGKARPNMLVLLMPPKKGSENIHLNPGSLRQRGRTR